MYYYEGMRCPVCGRPFQSDDDVVVCPVCGLPHHRACWKQEGHCHLAHLHGTDEQWSREAAEAATQPEQEPEDSARSGGVQICPRCRTENPEYAEFCCRCGCPLGEADWDSDRAEDAGGFQQPPYSEYMPFRSVFSDTVNCNPNEVIGDHKATDLASVIGGRTDYYLPRFRQIAGGRSGGWNWSAFLLGPYWLLYRKMYLSGGLLLLLQLLQSSVLYWIMSKLNLTDNAALLRFFSRDFQNRQELYYYLALLLLSLLVFAIRFALGGLGNRLYYHHSCELITRKREQIPDITTAELATVGGTSFSIQVIGYVSINVLSMLIQLLL